MLKKFYLIATLISITAQPFMAAPSDAPILNVGDPDTVWQNMCEVGNNIYAITRNVTRIGARIVVEGSAGVAKVTQYLADHPKTSFCALVGSGYGYYTWYQLREETRTRCQCHNPTLLQVLRTIRLHWRH